MTIPHWMARQMASVLLGMALLACATEQYASPYFAPDIRPIKQKEAEKFWVGKKVKFSADPDVEAAALRGTKGFVLAEIVIDSNGRIVEHKILQSEPNGFFTSAAEQLFSLSRYQPAPENEARVPVRFVRSVFFGNSKEARERFRRLLEEKGW